MRFVAALLATFLAAALAGCASRPVDERIDRVDLEGGYRVKTRAPQPHKDPETMLILAFSGGGTRAAAFSYGVLEELRRTLIKGGRRLIHEVDLITGVSGGSFTALAYALYGERLFQEYETRFLKRDVQGALIGRALSPVNWPALGSTGYGRSELAAEYYDEILFGGATFGDLLGLPTPTAVVTATDFTTGSRLGFVQDDFDLLCLNLGKVRLSRAAAASSAVPVVLSPVTLGNHGGNCNYRNPAWMQSVITPPKGNRPAGRPLMRYNEMMSFQDSEKRPYVHLVDGGVSDNLGLRGVLEYLAELESSKEYRKEERIASVKRLAVVVVNSKATPDTGWERDYSPPGSLAIMMRAASVPIDRYSYEQVELLHDVVARWNLLRNAYIQRYRDKDSSYDGALVPKVEFYPIDVSFANIADENDRVYFVNLPTTLVLPPQDVDRLRAMAGTLLRDSPAFKKLVKELGGSTGAQPYAGQLELENTQH